ncbi:MFS transporter [Burkholderia multivorans]|uniref:MFS transporter n=1 Tax=Burkholderia multivorans TaxID=87883 RepID=UPI000DAC6BA0|nr:MFS transporter [Burkholderia multivorans]MBR7899540.1 MFS transporter [Burkholderia multivorans]RAA28722.1 MFS transporter [Burkholderia multivorans]RAA32941.1 MFS transporter [Burkholderia multivorans]RAA33293.1 MFS transporter [Burkholderia multivorans]RAA48044.1 MFS transporter [Burkholderia multivorans]
MKTSATAATHDTASAAADKGFARISGMEWRSLSLAGLGWTFESYDSFLLSLLLPTLALQFGLSKAQLGMFTSVTAAGQIAGGILFGFVSDRIGRVRTALLCIGIYSLFSGLIAFAPDSHWFAASRFLGALGMGGTWTAGAALIAETWHPSRRGKGGALMQMGLPIGAILAIAISGIVGAAHGGLAGDGWRLLFLIGASPFFILFWVARKTPESPIWLERKHARSSVRQADAAAHEKLNVRGLLTAFCFIFFLQYLYWGVFTWTPTFLVTVKHLDFVHSLKFVLALQFGAMTGFLLFSAWVDRIGRRPMFLAYLLVGAIAVGVYIVSANALLLMIAIFLTGFSVNGIFAGAGPFLAEIIGNTASRGFFMGLAYNGGRLGGFIAPLIIGALASTSGGFVLGLATTIVAFIAAAAVVLFAPETRGKALS